MTDTIEQPNINRANDLRYVINTSNRAMYQGITPPDHFKDPYLSFDDIVQDFHEMNFYVYKSQDDIVGVTALEIETTEVGKIQRCYVLPSYQRKGIGTALMTHLQKTAEGMGLRQLKLHVGEAAYWAINFYRKLGYETIERQEQVWGVTLVMAKQLL
jgi:ribosomal protein S18 acetylase RimI-like enzyme